MEGNQIKRYCKRCGTLILNRDPSAEYCLKCLEIVRREKSKEAYQKRLSLQKKHFSQKCIFCGAKKQLYYHLDLNKRNSSKENLIPVCQSCNNKIHYLILKPFFKTMIRVLKDNRYSGLEIAKILGISSHIVYKHLNYEN